MPDLARTGRVPSVVTRTLLRHALVGSAALLLVGGVTVAVCLHLVRDQALSQAEERAGTIASGVVAPLIVPGVYARHPAALGQLDAELRTREEGSSLQRVKVWSPAGEVLYSDDRRLIGRRYPLDHAARDALATGGVRSDVSDLDGPENELDQEFGESVEVYAATHDATGRRILVETYFSTRQLRGAEAGLMRRITPVVLIALAVLWLLLVPLALARRAGRYERERKAMVRLAAEASAAERRRVAGELHDGVIHDLTMIGATLTDLDTGLDGLGPEPATATIGALRDTLHGALRLVHDDVLALRELTGQQYAADSGTADPVTALRVIADTVRDGPGGLTLIVELAPLPPLPARHRAALIRVGREALRNAARHAPGSRTALSLGVQDGEVVVQVADDGPGFEPATAPGPAHGHLGLALLADAAETVGGRLELRSRPGAGTVVRFAVPLAAPDPDHPDTEGIGARS
jgi:two-component system, NarL family, sensor kinase